MSGNNRFRIVIFQNMLISGIFLLWACSPPSDVPQQNEGTTAPIDIQQTPAPSTEGISSQMTPSLSTPAGLQNLIEMIKTDLASRQSISVDEIIVTETIAAEWSDSSLDCPQPGMEYLQVITPGYKIVLQVNGQTYEYHTNRDAYFVYCEKQIPPILPKP